MAHGPGQAVGKLIPAVSMSLLGGESPALLGGKYKSNRVYISDMIDCFMATISKSAIDGKTIDLGSGSLVSMRDAIGRIAGILGSNVMPAFRPMPSLTDENVAIADTKIAATLLGWRTTT